MIAATFVNWTKQQPGNQVKVTGSEITTYRFDPSALLLSQSAAQKPWQEGIFNTDSMY